MKSVLASVRFFLFFTVLTGIVYPLLVTGIAQLIFPFQSNGSILMKQDKPAGSLLIGQSFDSSGIYFASRPSAISYNPLPSGGSNYGLTSVRLKEQYEWRRKKFIMENMLSSTTIIPSEMLFASGSGLDPHITPEAAMLQVERICRARHFSGTQKVYLEYTIRRLTESSNFSCPGPKRINVLLLNLETDKIK